MPSSSGSPALSCPFLQPRGNSTSVLRKRSPVTTGQGIQMKFLTTTAVAAAIVFGAHAAHAGATVEAVKARGFLDRKRDVEGRGVSVRVDSGGRRIRKKKKT